MREHCTVILFCAKCTLPLFYFTLPVCPPIHQKKSVSFKTPFFLGEQSAVLSTIIQIYWSNSWEMCKEQACHKWINACQGARLLSLGCIAHISFSLQNICLIFLQKKTFMRLPHSSFPQEKVSVLIINEQVRYMSEITLK